MALAGSASRRYAEALFDLAGAAGAVPQYRESLAKLRAAFDRAALRLLAAPNIPLAKRMAGAAAALEGEPEDVRALVQLLVERGRIELLPFIATAFDDLVDRHEGVRRAKLTTAVPLDDAQQRELVARLERALGARIRATFATDESLIGGARVQVGDHLIDGSVRAQLDALEARLAS